MSSSPTSRLLGVLVLVLAATATARAQTAISGSVFDGNGGPLLSGTVYHATSIDVPVGQTLTVQAGAIVKFATAATFTVNGTLLCGAGGTPVQLVSLTDDSAGGDTNADGPSSGAAGDWFGLRFQGGSTASVLNGVAVRHAGRSGQPGIDLFSADITMIGVAVDENGGVCLDLSDNSRPTVSNCAFDGGTHAVVQVPMDAVAGFANNTATGNTVSDNLHIEPGAVDASCTIPAASLLNGAHVAESSISIGTGLTVSIEAGVTIKWPTSTVLTVNGVLDVNGTPGNPVSFVSIEDDSIGGDANGNGASVGTPGDWFGLDFGPMSDASVLDHLVLRHAGRSNSESMHLSEADITMTGCIVADGDGAALELNGNSFPTVTGCAFDTHAEAVIEASLEALVNFSGNTASGNDSGDYVRREGAATVASVTLTPDNLVGGVLLNVSNLTVASGTTLTLGQGVVFKWVTGVQLTIDGVLDVNGTAGSPVTMTSDRDDTVIGDSNGDGGATLPARGDWFGLRFTSQADLSDVAGLVVRYAGRSSSPSVRLTSCDATFTNCLVEESVGPCLDLVNNSFPTVTNCAFDGSDAGSIVNAPLAALQGFSSNTAAGNGIDAVQVGSTAVTGTASVTTDNVVGGAIHHLTNLNVDPGATLTYGPGVVTKMPIAGTLVVNGTLIVNGTTSQPVTFTSIRDDAVAGDTNKDGAATTPLRGDWFDIELNGSDASVLNGLRLRYGARSGTGALTFSGADAVLTSSSIELSGGGAIELFGGSLPTIVDVDLQGNVRLIDNLTYDVLPNVRRVTASGNDIDVFEAASQTIATPVTLIEDNLANGVMHCSSIAIGSGASLTLERGIALKFQIGSSLTASAGGTLTILGTAYRPVLLGSVRDDTLAGDTNEDGNATTPANGDWFGVRHASGGAGLLMEHAVVSRAGRSGTPAIDLTATGNAVRAVRVEGSGGIGFDIDGTTEDVFCCVAFGNNGTGFRLNGGNFNLVHCTSVDNGGFGYDKDGSHSGALLNSIAWANAAPLDNYGAAFVIASNAGPAVAGTNGNIDADPLFVDEANGDLELDVGSPCIDAADTLIAGLYVLDIDEGSRRTDSELTGNALADMGAHERAAYHLVVTGVERIGTTMTFAVTGAPPAPALLGVGFLDGFGFCNPCGYLTVGLETNVFLLGFVTLGVPLSVTMPGDPNLEGIEFGVQGLAVPQDPPLLGNLTERYRAKLFN